MAILSVSTGREAEGVRRAHMTSGISIPDVCPPRMAPSIALALRWQKAICPYNEPVWRELLAHHELLDHYDDICDGFRSGFNLNLPPILSSQVLENHSSLSVYHTAFNIILEHELNTGRYIGPFTRRELESRLGVFQTLPVSIIPKPGKPGKFRVIQNFSFPISPSPRHPQPSINSTVNSDDFMCTWGMFNTVCVLIRNLPAGSQGVTHDVAEAYRTIPLHYSQWAATVVHTGNDAFCVDTCTSFGMGPSAGAYGHVADTGADLMRAAGLGPLTKWVDDHLFFRLPRSTLTEYNSYPSDVHKKLRNHPPRCTGGRVWFAGDVLDDGSLKVFSEDCRFPVQDLTLSSTRDADDLPFTSNFNDINDTSSSLGIPWQISKDTLFAFIVLFIGLLWDIKHLTVGLSDTKKEKYLAAIADWCACTMHMLLDVQKLYGKLLHSCLIVPAGRAYLTSLEAMLGVTSSRPFVPYHAVRHLHEDLDWCIEQLSCPSLQRAIPQAITIVDAHGYSDASSGVGVTVIVHGYWRAWMLLPGWRTLNGECDIGWAEAVGFELLVRSILQVGIPSTGIHLRIHCDNVGIVEGWKNGRSRNWATNGVFRRIISLLAPWGTSTSFHLHYIASRDNPTDGPSHEQFPPIKLLLPPIVLPTELAHLLVDAHSTPSSTRIAFPYVELGNAR